VLNVKAAAHSSLDRLLLTGLISLVTCTAQAQTQPRPAQAQSPPRTAQLPTRTDSQAVRSATVPGTVVAVVDISAIFENHAGFKNAMEQMKQEVQQYEDELRTRHQALSKERDQMLQFAPGSQEYEKMERGLADKAAKLQVDTQLKKKEFLQRESKVYYQVYQEVSNAVREFAEMKGIDLVLRHNSEEMKPDDRQSVLQGVNRALVYQRNLDITREILDRLNRAPRVSARPSAATRAPQAPR
jgi:Skp family chaperone for outer membrane proteins